MSRRYKFWTWTVSITPAELLLLKGDIEDFRMLQSHYHEFKHLAYSVYEESMEISGIVRFRKQVLESRVRRIFGLGVKCKGANRSSYKFRLQDYFHSSLSPMRYEMGDEKTLRRFHEKTPDWVRDEARWTQEIARVKRKCKSFKE